MIELFHPEPYPNEIEEAASRISQSAVLARGPEVVRFEQQLEEKLGFNHAVAVSSGTAALHIAIEACGFSESARLVTSPYSFIATSNTIVQSGCEPIFGKTNEGLQLNLDHAAELLRSDHTIEGVVIPHIFGLKVDIEGIRQIRDEFPHVKVIEDAAQALAPRSYGLEVGAFGDVVAYSFHENKVLTTGGEGGAVATNSAEIADRLYSLRSHGIIREPDWINKIDIGYNYRLTELQAAIGGLQLARLDTILATRERLADIYNEEFGLPSNLRSWFAYPVEMPTTESAENLARTTSDAGISARQTPLPSLTTFRHNLGFELHDKQIEKRAQRIVLLPLHTRLDEDQVRFIARIAREGMTKGVLVSSSVFYDNLAHVYKDVLSERKSYIDTVNKIVETALSNLSSDSTVVDIGCGNGERTKVIAKALDARMIGFDSSEQMVARAVQNGVDARYFDISDPNASLPDSISAATMLWNVLGHVGDEQDRLVALKNAYKMLDRGGLLVLDANNRFNVSAYGQEAVADNYQQQEARPTDPSIGDYITSRRVGNGNVSTRTHIFSEEELVLLVEKAGFEVSEVTFVDYATGEITDRDNGQIVVVAKKVCQ